MSGLAWLGAGIGAGMLILGALVVKLGAGLLREIGPLLDDMPGLDHDDAPGDES